VSTASHLGSLGDDPGTSPTDANFARVRMR
jgi:hypothetical protein